MEAIEFIKNYQRYINEIEKVVKPEYNVVIQNLKEMDPHDIITPETWFQNESTAIGIVWSMFLKKSRNQ